MRITPRGRFAAGLAVVLWTLSLVLASVALAAGALLATLALAYALATLQRPQVATERRLNRVRFSESETLVEEIDVRLLSRVPVRATIHETATPGLVAKDDGAFEAILHHGEPLTRAITWETQTWGRKTLGPLRIIVQDALGLLEVEVKGQGEHLVHVQPLPRKLGKFNAKGGNPEPALGAHNVSKPGDGSEFFALREYQAGDSIRRINWKASARSSNTMVNQVTRDSFARVLVFLDLREKEGLGGLQSALVRNGRAAASILAHHERNKDHLTLVTVTDKAVKVSAMPNPRLDDLLHGIADAQPGGAMSMEAAVRAFLNNVKPRSPVYFVTSGVLDADLRDALQVVLALRARPWLVSPTPAPAEAMDRDAHRRLAVSRTETLREARSLGVPSADWPDGTPLEVVLSAL
jgi:uncharacterized protein (DUF58 family)